MKHHKPRFLRLIGATLASAYFSASAIAHECRALGQSQNETFGQYWICVGFAYEDGDRPRAGTLNNLDFFPIWVTPGGDTYLDNRAGDVVNLTARVQYLKGNFFDVPVDADFHVTTPWLFFQQQGGGYSAVAGRPSFNLRLPSIVTIDYSPSEIVYRGPSDFVTPYAGIYAWYVSGRLQRQGQPAVSFNEKFVSLHPRIPYGPEVVTDTSVSQFFQAPEGWFDGVKPAAAAARTSFGSPRRSSPPASLIMKRLAK